MLGSAT